MFSFKVTPRDSANIARRRSISRERTVQVKNGEYLGVVG